MKHSKKCPECGGTEIYMTSASALSQAMDLLPGLGGLFHRPRFDIFVCADCGYCRWFVGENWLQEIPERWARHE